MTPLATDQPAVYEIIYSREDHDYACYVTIDERREYIGSKKTYDLAEQHCRDYAYGFFTDNHTPETAAQIAAAMEPEPGPPVDDGPEDNFGGFRCPRRARVAAPSPDISLPPIDVLAGTAAELATAAQDAGDTANMHALNKAMMQLHQGTAPVPTTGGFLVESRTRGGVVHRVSTAHGCSCEAGAKGRVCWHAALLEIVEAAQQRAVQGIPVEAGLIASYVNWSE